MLLAIISAAAAQPIPPVPTVEIAKDVLMPKINLGTCCGSDPTVGLPAWLAYGGTGIDTAFDCE